MKKRLFFILWTAGLAGVLSLLLVDLPALIEALPLPWGEKENMPHPALLKLASVAQPAVLTTIAALVGVLLASQIGLQSPVAEAWARRETPWEPLRRQLFPGIIAGTAGGVLIALTWVIAKPFLTAEFIQHAEEFNKFIPHAVRFLYGGFTEEVLLRWGVMTFLVWALWRLFKKGRGEPATCMFVIAILLSSLLFGIGHLPVASMLNNGLDLPIVIYVVVANSLFGLIAGFLYWRRGLESAIIAHIFAHIVLIAAIALLS